ncbi:hypothetical protein V5N11_032256 [Cardamine amara subsp. amara]|uniref:Retrotransposon gag domain-containing protein n=1 Tax=Cardamine amara subsp. amara TaxID=228776 RepID=A0ABD0ZB57_CARAN
MVETKAMTQEEGVRQLEAALGSRIDVVLQRTQTLEGTVTAQNEKLDKNIADMFEAIRLLSLKHGDTGVSVSSPLSSTPNNGKSDQGKGRTGPQANYSGVTRLAKLDFPRFNGDKIKEWLFKVEQFFVIDHTPDDLKVGIASIHFDDVAATWHQSIMEFDMGSTVLSDWKTYKMLLQERFDEVLDDPRLT